MSMVTPAGISARGRADLTRVLAKGGRFITPKDVVEELGVDANTAAKKLARWAEDGWVRRVRRGLYIGVPVDVTNPAAWSEDALFLASEVWSPCYFTGWTSAHHWDLTEQVFRTTVLKTSARVRSSSAHLLDHDYIVNHVGSDALTWGLKSDWRGDNRLHFADPARTVVDILDSPKLGGGIRHGAEILAAYLNDNDPMLLIEYGDRLGNRTVFKRLGYGAEALGIGTPALIAACRERLSSGISSLDPDGPTGGHRIMRWGLLVNVTLVHEGAS